MAIVTIAGSPTANSRSTHLLNLASKHFADEGFRTEAIHVRELPAADLLAARTSAEAIAAAAKAVEDANVVIIGTPIYKASYAGLLKTFLDLLPQFGLKDKAVLAIATGGSSAHFLALDYGLRPVLASLGARVVVESVFVEDSQVTIGADGSVTLAPAAQKRFDDAIANLKDAHSWITGKHDPSRDPLVQGALDQSANNTNTAFVRPALPIFAV